MTTLGQAKLTLALLALGATTTALWCTQAAAQSLPPAPASTSPSADLATQGVPLQALAADAPSSYTIKTGDTLWAIASLFLKSPWQWPALWGMNQVAIKNPHLIYPGQRVVLERRGDLALLKLGGVGARAGAGASEPGLPTVRLSPQTRYEPLASQALPALRPSAIEPFLAEPLIVDAAAFASAPRIVSAQEGRVLLSRGDRAYARGEDGTPLLDGTGAQRQFRVFRSATALKDPDTGEVLGYEARYAGRASLVRGEGQTQAPDAEGKMVTTVVPATIDITSAKEEMRVGDRLLPEPPREVRSYTPQAPAGTADGRIVSVYGSAVVNAAQNQVVAINRGKRDGMEAGTVLAILKDGPRVVDKQDGKLPLMKLPDERNGLLMVFRTFDRVSYALVLEITDAVRVGDRLGSPR
ncbi:LysM peptidoglycan-binding domain-containing protein [Rhodoferax sp.]|uniref:LysM peptidoglycan-binding domain-containing protein n=1 Tax=Rhodoferax sp. TaxID=50421 RepID=UPI0037843C26